MKKIEIIINGKSYPCKQTMGAMLRFKQETGKEVTEIGQGDLTDLCTYLWCCVVSACKAEGVEFGMTLMDFADSLGTDEMQRWTEGQSAGPGGGEEKKTA